MYSRPRIGILHTDTRKYCQAQGPLSRPGKLLDKFMNSQERTLR